MYGVFVSLTYILGYTLLLALLFYFSMSLANCYKQKKFTALLCMYQWSGPIACSTDTMRLHFHVHKCILLDYEVWTSHIALFSKTWMVGTCLGTSEILASLLVCGSKDKRRLWHSGFQSYREFRVSFVGECRHLGLFVEPSPSCHQSALLYQEDLNPFQN